jgi:CTP synthase
MTKNTKKQTKYIFTTGGVLSSLGKGIASASLGLLLKQRGFSVTIIKMDPYINVDPGTMNPFQHGEVFVTDDGAETDLDLGHYERFLDCSLSKHNNHTAGQVYYEVISRERQGKYLGKTVQVIPHITDEIKERILYFDGEYDFVLVEIGGTVGDIESLPFLEAQRQLTYELGQSRCLSIHLTYVPYIKAAGELKTKPTQHSVKILMEYGIKPNILLCRTEQKLGKEVQQKIALFCSVDIGSVFEVIDVETIYEVPLLFAKRGLTDKILDIMNIKAQSIDVKDWVKFVKKIKSPRNRVKIGLIGKYTKLEDSYKSIIEAFIHAGSINNAKIELELINSEQINDDTVDELLDDIDGVLVGPGFGKRGIEGKIRAIQYVRENKIPFFGICLGMQCAVIEFSRNVMGWKDANSAEFEKTEHNVIDLMEEQIDIEDKGGTMRLGAYPAIVDKDTHTYKAYKSEEISERHRHRYEFNNKFRDELVDKGIVISGLSPDKKLVEIIEIADHPWFVGVQFHPELKSRAVTGHPLFISFIKSALKNRKDKEGNE